MYVIWNDQMYAAWDQFDPEPYLLVQLQVQEEVLDDLRHRDHVHISLSMVGAKGKTSWYDGRLP